MPDGFYVSQNCIIDDVMSATGRRVVKKITYL